PDTPDEFASRSYGSPMAEGMRTGRRLARARLRARRGNRCRADGGERYDAGSAVRADDIAARRAIVLATASPATSIPRPQPRSPCGIAAGQAEGRSSSPHVLGMRPGAYRQASQVLFVRLR